MQERNARLCLLRKQYTDAFCSFAAPSLSPYKHRADASSILTEAARLPNLGAGFTDRCPFRVGRALILAIGYPLWSL